jgi:hypothetical protein
LERDGPDQARIGSVAFVAGKAVMLQGIFQEA